MATAEQLRNELTSYMSREGIPYRVINESDNIVRLNFGGTSSKSGGGVSTTVMVDFDEGNDADSVHFVSYRFAHCSIDQLPEVLLKLNGYNTRFRWVKFYAQTDDDTVWLHADSDAHLVSGHAAEECVKTSFIMSDIVEDALIDLGHLVSRDDDDGDDSRKRALGALARLLGGRG